MRRLGFLFGRAARAIHRVVGLVALGVVIFLVIGAGRFAHREGRDALFWVATVVIGVLVAGAGALLTKRRKDRRALSSQTVPSGRRRPG